MEIDKEIIEKTVNCRSDFSCLKNVKHTCCEVISCISEKVHFVDFTCTNYCSYLLNYGDSQICTCPARKDIYNKYKV